MGHTRDRPQVCVVPMGPCYASRAPALVGESRLPLAEPLLLCRQVREGQVHYQDICLPRAGDQRVALASPNGGAAEGVAAPQRFLPRCNQDSRPEAALPPSCGKAEEQERPVGRPPVFPRTGRNLEPLADPRRNGPTSPLPCD